MFTYVEHHCTRVEIEAPEEEPKEPEEVQVEQALVPVNDLTPLSHQGRHLYIFLTLFWINWSLWSCLCMLYVIYLLDDWIAPILCIDPP